MKHIIKLINRQIECIQDIKYIMQKHGLDRIIIKWYSENDDHQLCHTIQSIIINNKEIFNPETNELNLELLGEQDTAKLNTAIWGLLYDTDTLTETLEFTKADLKNQKLNQL
jgi:hypothetical protein